MPLISAGDAASEILRRKSVRASLQKWCEANGYQPAKHHRLLIEKLEAVARGEIERLAVFMPPGSAKSTYASILFPPWLLAQLPKAQILAASHTTELAERWGRRVRNLIAENRSILDLVPTEDNQAAGRWALKTGGEYMAAGAMTGIAGFRALIGLIDDPIRSRQDADSLLIRDRLWDWYLNDFRPRLVPHARQVLIQCMTGDTPVLMANGSERRLRNIRRNDLVATYNHGKLTASVVDNWASNGLDHVFAIKMASGVVVKANARHPFLVCESGETRWIRTSDLRPGHEIFRVNGANGGARPVRRPDAICLRGPKAIATRIITKNGGWTGFDRLPSILHRAATRILSTATELISRITGACLLSRAASAPSVGSYRAIMSGRTGAESSASIIATTPARSGDCFATTAISSSVTPERQRLLSSQPITSDFTLDRVTEIAPAGIEEVFDVQIYATKNFIANGLVSHNTRWHEDDLAGRALNHQHWDVLSLPALAKQDDALGRAIGEPLWGDDDYGYGEQLLGLQNTTPPRIWSALYQQEPTPDEGDYFKEEWLRPIDILPGHKHLRIYGGSDYAVTQDGGDYTVHAVFGVDHLNNLYLIDIWRAQTSAEQWVEAFCDLVEKYRPLDWAEELGQIRSGVGPYLDRRMRQRRLHVNRTAFPTRGDKAVRARSIQGRMALDGLFYPKNATWAADWLAELLNFPASKHDDQVDAMGLCGQLLDIMVSGRAEKPNPMKLPNDGYRRDKRVKTVDALTL